MQPRIPTVLALGVCQATAIKENKKRKLDSVLREEYRFTRIRWAITNRNLRTLQEPAILQLSRMCILMEDYRFRPAITNKIPNISP